MRVIVKVTKADITSKPGRAYWGYHLIIDMGGCDERINMPDAITNYFKHLISEIKMKTLTDIILKEINDGPQNRGISAMQMITTSSITFHGDAEGNQAFIDIFSCKNFDSRKALARTKSYFEPKSIKSKMLYRNG
jgi:S-adenosylmethionine/arginine decarboxylase-like enzyme